MNSLYTHLNTSLTSWQIWGKVKRLNFAAPAEPRIIAGKMLLGAEPLTVIAVIAMLYFLFKLLHYRQLVSYCPSYLSPLVAQESQILPTRCKPLYVA